MIDEGEMVGQAEQNLQLRIEPVDTLFFRDGRPFGATSRAASGLPKPQTIAGALRTTMLLRAGMNMTALAERMRTGCSFAEAASSDSDIGAAIGAVRFRGPWFGCGSDTLYPAPATLRRTRCGKFARLDPLDMALPGWVPAKKGMKPLWHKSRQDLEPVAGYLTSSDMAAFLAGCVPGGVVPDDELFEFDDRTGISVDPARGVAADGMIYAVRLLALRPGVCLRAEVKGPKEALDLFRLSGDLVALGGEGRRALVTPERGHSSPLPAAGHGTDGRLLVLTAPAPLNGWHPRGLDLLSAAVPGHEAVSGWDIARGGPKPNRFAVPAGSVYFLPPGSRRPSSDSLAEAQDAEVGWGSYLEGAWKYV